MATNYPDLIAALQDVAAGQKEVVRAISEKSGRKDFWDKFASFSTFFSSVIIAGMATIFTHEYDKQQLNVNELTILEKFVPFLASGTQSEQEVSIIEISALGDTNVAARLAKLYPNAGTLAGLQSVAKNGDASQQAIAKDAIQAISASRLAQLNIPTAWTQRTLSYVATDEALVLNATKTPLGSTIIGYGVDIGMQPDGGRAALKAAGVVDPDSVIAGKEPITVAQADALLEGFFVIYITAARQVLGPNAFNSLSDARRCVVVEFMYNSGPSMFDAKIAPFVKAAVNAKSVAAASQAFANAATAIEANTFSTKVGTRNGAMMRTGQWRDIPDPNIVPLFRLPD